MGLVNKVVPVEELEKEGLQWASEVMEKVHWRFVALNPHLMPSVTDRRVFRNWLEMQLCFIIYPRRDRREKNLFLKKGRQTF